MRHRPREKNHSQDPHENEGLEKKGEKKNQPVNEQNFKTTPGGKDEATNRFLPDVARTRQDRTCPEVIKSDGVKQK